jgi:hypothetical protein
MNPILAAGLLIGVFCGLWTYVMGITGWYKDPAMMRAFYVVIPIQFGGLVWGLRQTARQGRAWASQLVAGTFMSVIGGMLVVASSLLFTLVFFPDFFTELEQAGVDTMRRQGVSEPEIAAAVERSRTWATPMTYAFAGFITTLIIGILSSASIALVVRARPVAPDDQRATSPGSPPRG